MWRLLKFSLLFAVLLIVTLIACTPATTPVPPTPTNPPPPTTAPPTPTNPPSPTSMPSPTVSSKSGPSIKGKFDAGGVNLNLLCFGEGSPTVVFDAAWGENSNAWLKTMLELRSHTRVCAYDRASMGLSDSQTGLRTSGEIAEQLHTLLASAKVEGPYLVVGHSLGGMNMLVFADRYRDEVAGLVLVESLSRTHELG